MPEVKLVIVALLLVGLGSAMLAPAPRVSRPFEAVLLGLLAGGFYLVAAGVAVEVSVHAGTLLIAPGVITFCLSCWLSRGLDHGGGGGGDGEDDGPEPDSPFDWAEFDRLRAEWGRTPVPA